MAELGALIPQTEIGADPVGVRDFAQAAEDMGYAHLAAYEHTLGANVDRPDRAGGRWPYTHRSLFHEPFVLFGYLAAVTRRVGLLTSIVILPQRPTALVAKQAAEVDVLSGGRLRLGVGLGWNAVEYEALGADFHNRGRRIEEQIALLRALWTQELVTFEGRWHRITDAGINPLPVQRPIPIWMGGGAEPAMRRIGRLADGWILSGRPTPQTAQDMARARESAREAGRDPGSLGLQGSVLLRAGGPEVWREDLAAWQAMGATHVMVNTMGAGLESPSEHIAALQRVKEALG
jgi:probable F420-dependent oxidoreductase